MKRCNTLYICAANRKISKAKPQMQPRVQGAFQGEEKENDVVHLHTIYRIVV